MTPGFWIILITVLVYGLVHSLLASLKAKALARRWFGPSGARWFRLVYNLVASLTLLPVLALPVLLPDKVLYRIPLPWLSLTLALQAAAVLGALIGLRHTGAGEFLGLRQLQAPGEASPPRLVTRGLYRYVRHPLYTAGLVFIWLMPLMSCNLLALNIGLSLYIWIGALVEERKLLHEYGEAYAEYQRRTPMLIPGLRLPRRR
jgi:protein-S-isoprenylcysteine O-methyltransferase Ste14